MKDLSPVIRELLYSNDCVILPGFGGFIGNYTPAAIDRENHTFTPPVKAISFNSKLDNNDGLLIAGVSEKTGVGYSAARDIVENYIGGLRKKLSRGERVYLEGIGYFQENRESKLQFEPDKDINYLLDSYGLSSFRREPVEGYDVREVISGRSSRRDPLVVAGRRRMLWRAAVAIPFVLAMVVVPLKTDLFRSETSLNPLAGVQFEEIEKAQENLFSEMPSGSKKIVPDEKSEQVPGDPAEVKEEVLAGDKQRAGGDVTSEPVEKADKSAGAAGEVVVASQGSYHLVVGSFRSQENARTLFSDLVSDGHDAGIENAGNGYFRVIINSFPTRQGAVDERTKLREHYPQIWIWKK